MLEAIQEYSRSIIDRSDDWFKFRQKEATGIVNSMIKSAQSNYGLFAKIPEDMGDISKFAKFQISLHLL